MREAAMELAAREGAERTRALKDFAEATRNKLHDLETAAQRGIARLARK